MKLVLIKEGEAYTVYALECGDRYDLTAVLSSLEQSVPKESDQMGRRLIHLAESGVTHDERKYRSLGDGLFEAKTLAGTKAIFFYRKGWIIICTSAFGKKRKRTDPNQIKRAKRRRKSFLRAQEQGLLDIIWEPGQREPRRKP